MAILEQASREEIAVAARRSRIRSVLATASFMTLVYAVLVLLSVITMLPYLWMVMQSFKTTPEFFQNPFSLIPNPWVLEGYRNALGFARMGVFLRNSLAYTVVALVVQLTVNSFAAYAFARIRFKGSDVLFILFLATMMLPGSVTLIPNYVLVYSLRMADTFIGVVIPSFAGAFGVFLLRQFFLGIPSELEDAARIDGASRFRIYWQIIVPLAKPAMVTLGVFIVIDQWQSFIWPLVVLNDTDKYPITVGLTLTRNMGRMNWPVLLAGSVIGSAPLIAIFLISQKFLIGGITLSGLKG